MERAREPGPALTRSDFSRRLAQTDHVGTLAWIRRTDGRLNALDRLRLLGQGVAFQWAQLPWQLTGPIGLRPRKRISFDLESLKVPDSAAARAAEELCAQMRPLMLVNHSYRTFVWASAIACARGESYDNEVLYVSSLLHDLGLSEPHRRAFPACFTCVGADAAELAGTGAGWPARRSRLAAEAITLHMNLRIPKNAIEAQLMTSGTLLDVIGADYWRIHPETVRAVLELYPRHEVKRRMLELFKWQARYTKGSRAHFYYRYLALGLRIRTAPFKE